MSAFRGWTERRGLTETGSLRTACLARSSSPPGPTTHSLTTGDFPRAFGILRFVGLISIPAVRSENL